MLGKKLRITGKGRCNVTNACDIEEMLRHVPVNARFLYSALYSFTNDDLIALLHKQGVETKVERGGRVFPVSDSAKDVVEGLKRYALQSNVRLIKKEAGGLLFENGAVRGVKFKDGRNAFVRKRYCRHGRAVVSADGLDGGRLPLCTAGGPYGSAAQAVARAGSDV